MGYDFARPRNLTEFHRRLHRTRRNENAATIKILYYCVIAFRPQTHSAVRPNTISIRRNIRYYVFYINRVAQKCGVTDIVFFLFFDFTFACLNLDDVLGAVQTMRSYNILSLATQYDNGTYPMDLCSE